MHITCLMLANLPSYFNTLGTADVMPIRASIPSCQSIFGLSFVFHGAGILYLIVCVLPVSSFHITYGSTSIYIIDLHIFHVYQYLFSLKFT
jgi:FPC/CPF motif-containing protein YcgG